MWVIPYIKVKWKRHWPKLLIVTVTLLLIHPLRFSESWLSTRGLGAQDIPGVLIPNAALSPLYMAKCQLSMDQLALWTPPGPRDKTQRLKVTKGGTWRPDSCQPRYDSKSRRMTWLALKKAFIFFPATVVVPFRNRAEHLEAFLLRMHPFLQAQNMSYSIFVVEQLPGKLFNRAKLFNVGALEAQVNSIRVCDVYPPRFMHFSLQKMRKNLKQCFIFHDVDLLPLNAQNLYACSRLPTHLSTFVDTFRFNLPYTTLFGGAIAISQDTFQAVNGFSNRFSGNPSFEVSQRPLLV